MNEVNCWTRKNKLILNVNKTKVMLLGSRQKLSTLSKESLQIRINNKDLECVSEYKCLGVVIDKNLTFSKHAESVAKTMQQKLGVVRRLKGTFTASQLSRIYCGFVLPHALYCSSVWSSRSENNHQTINRLHKRAAYIISGCTWQISSNQVFQSLGWKSLRQLHHKSIACMVFKCVAKMAPTILSSRLRLVDDISMRTTRSSNRRLLNINQCNTEFYKKTFINVGTAIWNSLTNYCRMSCTLAAFKQRYDVSAF